MATLGVESHVTSIVARVDEAQDHVGDVSPLPGLSAEQVRLLGCLMEKERTTPADYPLTANALQRAANQSTSRDPVVQYGAALVDSVLVELKDLGLVRFVYSPSNRATKFRQVLTERLELDEQDAALLCVLLLRGPQTAGELNARTDRLAGFASVAEVGDRLVSLSTRGLVGSLERAPGRKEQRWTHLLGGETPGLPTPSAGGAPDEAVEHWAGAASARSGLTGGELADRVSRLEQEVGELRSLVAGLCQELGLPVPAVTPPA